MARIVQVAPDLHPIPSHYYGGIEKIVFELTEKLVQLGHEVFLYAPAGSRTSAKLIPYVHNDRWNESEIVNRVLMTLPANTSIIHDHTHNSVMGKPEVNTRVPIVFTVHMPAKINSKHAVYVSKKALEAYGENNGYYIYNGINPDEFEFSNNKDDYLLYLGILLWRKGVHLAIDVAEKTGKKLIIAGPADSRDYFTEKIKPKLSNPNIQYIGAVSGKLKQLLLKYAKCVLFPSIWDEPFGLVMIESMACGTPVLALPNGAAPEVLKEFPDLICSSVDVMASRIFNNTFPPPLALREYVRKNYTTDIMADKYIQLYKKLAIDIVDM